MTRQYSSISVETTLASSINTTVTTMTVATGTATALMGGVTLAAGNVDIFTIAIDPDTVNEEIVYVTQVSGDTLTISRGQAGTGSAGVSGISHTAGATVKHVLTSSDLILFNTAIQPSTLTAKGDIYAASASATVGRVGVGTNGQVLTADSTQTRGLAWTTLSSTPRIAQVVKASCTSVTTAGTSYTDVSGLSVTITPTLSTSKVLILSTYGMTLSNGGSSAYFSGLTQLVRGSTSLQSQVVGGYYPNGSGGLNTASNPSVAVNYLDSPATTSATTYKIQIQNIWGSPTQVTGGQSFTGDAQIIAMEVLV